MKLIDKDIYNRWIYEKYELDDLFVKPDDDSIGVLLLYIIVNYDKVQFIDFIARADGDIGDPDNLLYKKTMDIFCDLNTIMEIFKDNNYTKWNLTIKYMGEKIWIKGSSYAAFLLVKKLSEPDIDISGLVCYVENETYNYHDFDVEIISKMKRWFALNQKEAVCSLHDLETYTDIYEEFICGMKDVSFKFPTHSAIEEGGFSAEQLSKNYPLSELEAYKYLICLREKPEETLINLNKLQNI
jgi:hypothetical protein